MQVPFEDTTRGMCDQSSQWHCFHEQVTRNIPEMIAFSGFFCIFATHIIGKMLEWLKRHAWKACSRLKRLTGSNPVLSAKAETCIQAELVRAKVQVSAFASPRRRRSGMCEHSEQIPRKERDVRAGGAGCANAVSKSHERTGCAAGGAGCANAVSKSHGKNGMCGQVGSRFVCPRSAVFTSRMLCTEKDVRMRWIFGNYAYICARNSAMDCRI